MQLPSAEIDGARLLPFPWWPLDPGVTLIRVMPPPDREHRKMSQQPLESPLTRLVAPLANTTTVPWALIMGVSLQPFDSVPLWPRLIRDVVAFCRSRTKMSLTPFVSPETRLVALLSNGVNDI